ncbi:hypothetical protein AB1Y20_007291 [Prymnesium parvum]|uniref:Uncharacterized protein n=1 Tax=Prymnesium parvum TaxID=97485 RepID=A0AB34IUJ8_PRYPA
MGSLTDLRAAATAIHTYSEEIVSANDFGPQLRAALDAATLHAASAASGGVGARELSIVALNGVATEWERLRSDGAAWEQTVADVTQMLAQHEALQRRRALLCVEQLQMALLSARALAAARPALDGDEACAGCAAAAAQLSRASLALAAAMASRARHAFAAGHLSPAPVLPAEALAEQDGALPHLRALACEKDLRWLRRLTLSQLLHAAAEMERALEAAEPHAEWPAALHPTAACAQCAAAWDGACVALAAAAPAGAAAGAAVAALLGLLRYLRPLALGAPPPPSWLRPLSRAHPRPALAAASAAAIQRRWRARQARWAHVRSLAAAAAAAAARGAALEARVLRTRAAILSDRSAEGAAAALLAALRPSLVVAALHDLQRRSMLHLACLALVLTPPPHPAAPPAAPPKLRYAQRPPGSLSLPSSHPPSQTPSPPRDAPNGAGRARASSPPLPAAEPRAEGGAVRAFWEAHFGGEASASFEKVRGALAAELGNLSSVDLQLLRLELMDERGRLSRGALGRIMWDEAGEAYGSVADAVKALLRHARAQLELQVEARMQQALSTRPAAAREPWKQQCSGYSA